MARVKQARRVLAKALDSVNGQIERTVIADMTFAHDAHLTNDQRVYVERYVAEHFKIWATSWVQPYIEQAIDILDGKEIPWSQDLSRGSFE